MQPPQKFWRVKQMIAFLLKIVFVHDWKVCLVHYSLFKSSEHVNRIILFMQSTFGDKNENRFQHKKTMNV